MEEYQLKGWDWTELGVKWGLIKADSQGNITDNRKADNIEKELLNYICDNYKQNDNVINDMRLFLQQVINNNDAYRPLWEGLLGINNKFAFVQMYCRLLTSMWT